MPDYISKYTGGEIDEAIGKTKSITKDATEINKALQYVDNTQSSINALNDNELISKRADGTLISTGIINESDKIFFPKDGRFPSGSIDVGPGATISENGGWLQYRANTLGKDYLLLDYYVDSTGTTKPVYWQRSQEEKDVIINPYNVDSLTDVTTFTKIPTTDSQINAIYLDFINPVSNFMVEIVSLVTNKPIKYIPDEATWKSGVGGLDLNTGINNILQGSTSTPFSALKSYQLKFNFKSSNPINVKGNLTGNIPWLKVDRQLITAKNVLVEGDGTGSSDSPEQIRDKLQTLTDLNRLDASSIKNLPSGGSDSATQIRDKLISLQGDERLGIEDLKNVEDTISGDYVATKLQELTGEQRLDASAIKNLPSGGGSSTFIGLSDTPSNYSNAANKMVTVNSGANGLEFMDVPTGSDVNNQKFIKAFGIEALNQSGSTINANKFVMLAPKNDNTFAMVELTHTIGYKGELIGYIRNSVANGAKGFVEIITTIITGESGTAVGQISYIGFDSDSNLANVQISNKDGNAVTFGSCGVFGEKNSLGEAYSSFNGFQVQTEMLIKQHHNSDIAYYDNLPAVISKSALFVHLVANIISPNGTIFQQLPLLSDVSKGMEIMVENQSVSEMAKVTLQATGNDKINNLSTLDVFGNSTITLIATNSGWFEVYNSNSHSNSATIMIGQTHGDYRQGRVEEINVHAPLDLTFDPDGKSVGLAINPIAFANKNLQNVLENDFDQKFKETTTYNAIWSRLPQLKGVKAKYIEEQGALTENQFNVPEQIIHIVYQIVAEDQNIQQALPSTSINKILIIQMIYSTGINNGRVTLIPKSGEQFKGTSSPYIIDKEGMAGTAFSELANWDWIPYGAMPDGGIEVNDQRSNFFIGMKSLAFGAGFTATQDPSQKDKVKIDYQGNGELTFVDGMTKQEFTANKVQSIDKSIRISNFNNGIADLSKGLSDHNEGIHVFLGNDQLINSKYERAKLYFSDTRVKGGMFVYPDNNTKSFIIQDVDPQDDPNISGGTTFIIALYYEPNPYEENSISQNGSIELEFVDDNDDPILDINDNPMGSKIDYKIGDKVKPELYIGECKATASTRVHLKIKLDFPTEEFISVGANTQLCIQAISKDESSGLALLSFMAFTGYRINFDTKYYGFNSLNLAQMLIFPEAETDTEIGTWEFGNNIYLNFEKNMKIAINNYHLILKDDNTNIPVWSLTKFYNKIDSKYISGKKYKITATLTDKDDAFIVAMLEYKGLENTIPIPKVLRYDNDSPIFTDGWNIVDSMFISEDVVSGEHAQSKEFTIPINSTGIAIIMYAVNSQIPMTLQLKDLEGDITPWFNKVIITDNSHITEEYLKNVKYMYKSVVSTPKGLVAYRYTCNNSDTKVPIGVITGGDSKIINDNAWTDSGAFDPNKVQGDLKFLQDGNVTMSYTAKCYNEQSTVNQIQFWLAKNNGGGTFTEVPNSRIATTIEGNRIKPKMVTSSEFTFNVIANESYRMFMKSDKADGFYIQSETNGVPLFESIINFDEITSEDKLILDKLTKAEEVEFIKDSLPVADQSKYRLQIDVDSGKTTIKEV